MMKSKIEEMTSTNPYDGAIRTKDGHRIGIGDYIKIPFKDLIAALPLKAEPFRDTQDKDGNVLFLVNNISGDFEYFLLANDHKSTHLEEYISVALVERCGEYVGRMVSEAKNDCGEVVSRVITKEDIADLNDKIKVADKAYNSAVSSIMRSEANKVMECGVKHISEACDELRNIISENAKKALKTKEIPYTDLYSGGDKVNHPSHYSWLKDLCGVEPIDICRHFDFAIGSALKYLMRKGKEEMSLTEKEQRAQDLKKAVFYIQDEIKLLEETDERN